MDRRDVVLGPGAEFHAKPGAESRVCVGPLPATTASWRAFGRWAQLDGGFRSSPHCLRNSSANLKLFQGRRFMGGNTRWSALRF